MSARVDGEITAPDENRLDHHLSSCASCRDYEHNAFALRRSLQMHSVERSDDDVQAVHLAGSLRGVSFLRWALVIIGATLVIVNCASIIFPNDTAAAHLVRHDGVFGTALGIGMLAVAAKPHRAIGLVPITSAIAVLMAIAATVDVMTGSANLLAEAAHIVQFAGLVCLWVISGGPSRLPVHLAAISQRLPTTIGG